ncbi:MAG: NUDIX hydrolase [Candidatus Colwellbacteria bacterium CG10_big_fil_rev_8_21_14_0_10_41_28]|uniref:NUDIX hydrolase n=1 Tax=Candidatus Colwellbacteria bacterium CG10_big_fil_rev_8_21_14_0_10_41_28 TaxID=1974539 RepID=A0A2H0VH45_9BACT|nr:MAG: NUDIX hydrolase [Candidatus Colwellbacteria bacterium CG10_big_fil_rev_8_21_14_0_10_41_28]
MKTYHKITCAAYLLPEKEGKILLLRRYNTGYEDGNYSVVAGHVDEGESILQTMIREAKEEAGIDIDEKDLELVHVMHRMKASEKDERVDFFFRCKNWLGEIKNMEPHKCDDLSWFELSNLPDNVIPYIKEALNLIDRGQLYSEFGWND